jgi:hypothetical protein
VTDFLEKKRSEINDRIAELRPVVEEYQRLEAAASALSGLSGRGKAQGASKSATSTTPRRPGRPRGSSNRPAAKKAAVKAARSGARRGGGRPKGSGVRAAQAVNFVAEQPGITIPELAKKMGIKPNYLYRVLPGLEKEGKIKRKGHGWDPAGK